MEKLQAIIKKFYEDEAAEELRKRMQEEEEHMRFKREKEKAE
jgi:hypothetical protein